MVTEEQFREDVRNRLKSIARFLEEHGFVSGGNLPNTTREDVWLHGYEAEKEFETDDGFEISVLVRGYREDEDDRDLGLEDYERLD